MYPSSAPSRRFDRVLVDCESSAFWAGTQFKALKEITVASGASYVIKMNYNVDSVVRVFNLTVETGEIRLEILRGATFGGTFSDTIQSFPKNETQFRPTPYYVGVNTLVGGGTATGGALYNLAYIKVPSAGGQASSALATIEDVVGPPAGAVSAYKFTNTGAGSATCIFYIAWDELPS